nr:MAG TPA: Thioredoxin-1 Catalytic Activity, Water Cavity [Caudoviricetes sp.]
MYADCRDRGLFFYCKFCEMCYTIGKSWQKYSDHED